MLRRVGQSCKIIGICNRNDSTYKIDFDIQNQPNSWPTYPNLKFNSTASICRLKVAFNLKVVGRYLRYDVKEILNELY